MRISDWSSDVCSSDLLLLRRNAQDHFQQVETAVTTIADFLRQLLDQVQAETADRAIIDVGVEVRRRRGGGVEGRAVLAELQRSEERRVGKECVRTCRSRGSPGP